MQSVNELVPKIGLVAACTALAMNRSFVYRERARGRRSASPAPRVRPRPPLALSSAEQQLLLGVLDSERFVDAAPATIFATLLDEGRYHGSVRTMYRLLAANDLAEMKKEGQLECKGRGLAARWFVRVKR